MVIKSLIKLTGLLFLAQIASAGPPIVQLKDFLCGCEYCETVHTGEPLDIGRHMILCHSWRDATLKTMRIMEEMKTHGTPVADTLPTFHVKKPPVEEPISNIIDINDQYEWIEDDLYGVIFVDSKSTIELGNQWIYSDELGWVWVMGDMKEFLYSEARGWLYNTKYNEHKILYWYDRKLWYFSHELSESD